jgi:hypothetical protein
MVVVCAAIWPDFRLSYVLFRSSRSLPVTSPLTTVSSRASALTFRVSSWRRAPSILAWRLGDSKYLPFGQQVRGSDVLLLHGITTRHCYIFCLDHDCSCLPNFTFTKPCGKGSIPNLFAIRLRNLGCPNDDFPFRWRSKPRQHEWFPMSAETINPLWITVPNDQLWQNQPQSRLPSS